MEEEDELQLKWDFAGKNAASVYDGDGFPSSALSCVRDDIMRNTGAEEEEKNGCQASWEYLSRAENVERSV